MCEAVAQMLGRNARAWIGGGVHHNLVVAQVLGEPVEHNRLVENVLKRRPNSALCPCGYRSTPAAGATRPSRVPSSAIAAALHLTTQVHHFPRPKIRNDLNDRISAK
jgi:hypothetical protein